MPKAVVTITSPNCSTVSIKSITILFWFASTTCSLVVKPMDEACKVTLPAGATMEKDPSCAVDVPVALPFTVIVTPVTAELSLEETTLPVIVRSCANNDVPNSNMGIINKHLSFGISGDLEINSKKYSQKIFEKSSK